MAGTVFLRTNRFEVKLEGITFKQKDFEQLCAMDFLFPKGKVWLHPPVVGLDVMRHPRDPTVVLMLLCFGIGCVVLRFRSGESLSEPILKFLTDERIRFVGFGIPEKKDLFPFQKLGFTKSKTDIGYIAAKLHDNPKYAKFELADLARKVLGIKEMVGLTEASSFERHEQIKCAICQLFISSVIAMSLLRPDNKKKFAEGPKESSFLKTLNSLPLLNEGWFKIAKGKKDDNKLSQVVESFSHVRHEAKGKEDISSDSSVLSKSNEGDPSDDSALFKKGDRLGNDFVHVTTNNDGGTSDDSGKVNESSSMKPLKGILKCPSSSSLLRDQEEGPYLKRANSKDCNVSEDQKEGPYLKRANSKGCNVSFRQ